MSQFFLSNIGKGEGKNEYKSIKTFFSCLHLVAQKTNKRNNRDCEVKQAQRQNYSFEWSVSS